MSNKFDHLPNGYQETIEKGLNALHVFSRTSYGVGTREKQLKRLKAELKNANAIVIGAAEKCECYCDRRRRRTVYIRRTDIQRRTL